MKVTVRIFNSCQRFEQLISGDFIGFVPNILHSSRWTLSETLHTLSSVATYIRGVLLRLIAHRFRCVSWPQTLRVGGCQAVSLNGKNEISISLSCEPWTKEPDASTSCMLRRAQELRRTTPCGFTSKEATLHKTCHQKATALLFASSTFARPRKLGRFEKQRVINNSDVTRGDNHLHVRARNVVETISQVNCKHTE